MALGIGIGSKVGGIVGEEEEDGGGIFHNNNNKHHHNEKIVWQYSTLPILPRHDEIGYYKKLSHTRHNPPNVPE